MGRSLWLAVAVAFLPAASRADEPVRAPVPKAPEVPSIDGSYTVNYTYTVTLGGRGFGGVPGGAPVPVTRVATQTSAATIAKNQIVLGGRRGFDSNFDGWGMQSLPANTPQMMTYVIDPTKTPMAIDVISIDSRNKKTKQQGIIEVEGDRITIALARPDAERPKTTEENEEVTFYYFKKNPPPPRVEFRIVAMTVGKEAEAEKELSKLVNEGFELVSTTNPAAADPKASPTTVHFILKRMGTQHP
jgi:uncharacterized protein (TIGR03067 family)